MSTGQAFEELVRLMARLRGPGGCPWDCEQTHQSLKQYLIEETYEVIEAMDGESDEEFCEELGDLLLQIVFHAQMASEEGRFAIGDVTRAITRKLIRRHPHVFGDTEVRGADEVARNWSRIKAEERRDGEHSSALSGVPRAMPALLRAQRLGEKASHVSFDWPNADGVLDKLREELGELAGAMENGDAVGAAAELGDLLFAATSLARHLGFSAEDALGGAADRFVDRFTHMEVQLKRRRRDIHEASDVEMDALWQEAKRNAR